MKKVYFILAMCIATSAMAQNEILWRNNFGGNDHDIFYAATIVSDGIVAVGYSEMYSFGNGDWEGIAGRDGRYVAIVVKFDNEGNVVWKKPFGGRYQDFFYSVAAVSDGFVAVGRSFISNNAYQNNGDWTGFTGSANSDATIVKFDNDGEVVWKKIFLATSASSMSKYNSVIATDDGVVAAGNTIAKYDNDGNLIWREHEGYNSVTAVSDGFVAVGDYVMTKYDTDGEMIWQDSVAYSSVAAALDGFIAVGATKETDDSDFDAVIAKYDNDGNEMWKKTFGGAGNDAYSSVIVISDTIIAVGCSGVWDVSFSEYYYSFGNGDLVGIEGKGMTDAIIVKYDNEGNVKWRKSFGGEGEDVYEHVSGKNDCVVAVGLSYVYGDGDWLGFSGKGSCDAITVKYDASLLLNIPELNIPTLNIAVYPNPTSGKLRIESIELKIDEVVIFDIYGIAQKIENRKLKTEKEFSMDISDLSPGVYLLKIKTEQGETIRRVLKH